MPEPDLEEVSPAVASHRAARQLIEDIAAAQAAALLSNATDAPSVLPENAVELRPGFHKAVDLARQEAVLRSLIRALLRGWRHSYPLTAAGQLEVDEAVGAFTATVVAGTDISSW
jgi:hypothetical protein